MIPAPLPSEWILAHIQYSNNAFQHGASNIPTLDEMRQSAYGRAILHCLIISARLRGNKYRSYGKYRTKKSTGLDNRSRSAGERDEDR